MASDLTHPPATRTVDVTGLPEPVVQDLQRLVQTLRDTHAAGGEHPTASPLSAADLDRLLDELSAGPPLPVLPPDFSRADIYDTHD